MAFSFIANGLASDIIPNFVTAKTKIGLRRAIAKNNIKHKGGVEYKIMWDPKREEWVAWFYSKLEMEDLRKVLANGR